jgi:hypothetical protein
MGVDMWRPPRDVPRTIRSVPLVFPAGWAGATPCGPRARGCLCALIVVTLRLGWTGVAGQQQTPQPPRPPWVLENSNVVPLDLPVSIRTAIRIHWEGIDAWRPLGAIADLNDDGVSDYLLKSLPEICGTGGCMYGVVDGKSATPLGTLFGNPLMVRSSVTRRFHDIDAYSCQRRAKI